MRLLLAKKLNEEYLDNGNVKEINLSGEELKDYLTLSLPIVMNEIVDPDTDPSKPHKYIENLFSNKLGNFDGRYVISIENNEIEGLLLGIRKDGYLHILTVGVNKSFRRRGLASLLLSKCFYDMYQEGIDKVMLNVHSQNTPAIDLYTKLGFCKEK